MLQHGLAIAVMLPMLVQGWHWHALLHSTVRILKSAGVLPSTSQPMLPLPGSHNHQHHP